MQCFTWLNRCLAHVINLATQALLATYSKTKHYDPAEPTIHEPDVTATQRDEVGLIRAIVVKVDLSFFINYVILLTFFFIQSRSSAKRKEKLKSIQTTAGKKPPLVLLLDMKVRWSSTFVMLQRAVNLSAVRNFSSMNVFDCSNSS